MTAVWALALPDSEKIVLLALADCANDEGHCWPSMRTLAAKCSKSDRTVQASIKALVDAGHLTRREVQGKGCNYTVHPRDGFAPEATSPRSHDIKPPKPVRATPEAASDKPSENQKEPSVRPRKRARSTNFEVPDWVPVEPWEAFAETRRRKKKPIDDFTAKQLFGRLRSIADAGWNIEDVITKATIHQHDGFWMPDGRDSNIRRANADTTVEWTPERRAQYLAKLNGETPSRAPPGQIGDLVGQIASRMRA